MNTFLLKNFFRHPVLIPTARNFARTVNGGKYRSTKKAFNEYMSTQFKQREMAEELYENGENTGRK